MQESVVPKADLEGSGRVPSLSSNAAEEGVVARRPSLRDLAEIGQLVSVVAVVISLVYLAAELRQNTLAVRANSFQTISSTTITLLQQVVGDSEFAEFYMKAATSPHSLTPVERVRWGAVMVQGFRHFENVHYQYRTGLLPEELWFSYDRTIRNFFLLPGWRQSWLDSRANYSASFGQYMASAIATSQRANGAGADSGPTPPR